MSAIMVICLLLNWLLLITNGARAAKSNYLAVDCTSPVETLSLSYIKVPPSGSIDAIAQRFESHPVELVMNRNKANTESWQNYWNEGTTPWVEDKPNDFLWKHFHHLKKKEKQEGVFLVPLCGKSVNLKLLYEQGFTVVGVECHEKAVQEFFEKQKLTYDTKPLAGDEDGIEYFTQDGRLRVLVTDFFAVTPAMVGGPVTTVWDRGAMGSIQKDLRKDYVSTMSSLLDPDVRYLLDVFHYKDWYYEGPPKNFPRDLMKDLLEDKFDIQYLDHAEFLSKDFSLGVSHVYRYLYLMNLKTKN